MDRPTKVILVGVGGATCSGKTTLAKHLNSILPDSVIIHQDDFAPAQHLIPIHPVHGVQDWDAAPGAIDWPLFTSFLRRVKTTGDIPPDHRSHDHLNEQKEVSVDEGVRAKWCDVFAAYSKTQQLEEGRRVVWGLVDGFLMYWHPDVMDLLDVRIFLRVPRDVLKQRRHERHGYHTAAQSDVAEGTLWRDPPGYFEQIVYPAYVDAHRALFENGDVERGRPTTTTTTQDGDGQQQQQQRFVLFDALEMDMDSLLEASCQELGRHIGLHTSMTLTHNSIQVSRSDQTLQNPFI